MHSGENFSPIDGTDPQSLLNLLMVISCFPQGIFLHHYKSIIEEGKFEDILSLPSDYLLPIVLLCKMSPKELKNPDLPATIEQEIAQELMFGDDSHDKIVAELVKYAGSGLYYLSIKYEKDEILILAHKGIRNCIRELVPNKSDLYNAFFVGFSCYQNLLAKMIKIAKQRCHCHEEVVEYNSLCSSPAWDFMYGCDALPDDESGQAESNLDKYLQVHTEYMSDFKQMFKHYDSNFGVLLIDQDNFFSIPSILEFASSCSEKIFIGFVTLFEDILIKMLTGNRICGENDRCRHLVQQLQGLTKLEINKKSLRRANFKAELHLACVWLAELQDIHLERKSPEFKQKLAEHLEFLKRLLDDLTQEKE